MGSVGGECHHRSEHETPKEAIEGIGDIGTVSGVEARQIRQDGCTVAGWGILAVLVQKDTEPIGGKTGCEHTSKDTGDWFSHGNWSKAALGFGEEGAPRAEHQRGKGQSAE